MSHSDPPITTSLPPLPDPQHHPQHPHQHQQPLHLPIIHGGTTPSSSAAPTPAPVSTSLAREYRKGNWTIQETLILITAKKLDDERRLKTTSSAAEALDPTRAACSSTTSTSTSTSSNSRTSGELRWKWVENYCWSHGCLRSQNQCNDKWDNLLRDYKKVRDYESKSDSNSPSSPNSYWALDKHQRKERNLPSNMVLEVYQAITDVLQRKHAQTTHKSPNPLVPLTPLTTPVPIIQPPPPPPMLPPPQTQPSPPPPPPPPHAPPGSATPAASGIAVIIIINVQPSSA